MLSEADVRFLIVGGFAVTLQGYVRFTEDIDLLIARDDENLQRLLSCLSNFGEGYAAELSCEDFTDEEGAIRIIEHAEQCQIDVFTRLGGRTYEDARSDASMMVIGGHDVYYASRAALIGWKETSVREKDRMDAKALRLLDHDPNAFD